MNQSEKENSELYKTVLDKDLYKLNQSKEIQDNVYQEISQIQTKLLEKRYNLGKKIVDNESKCLYQGYKQQSKDHPQVQFLFKIIRKINSIQEELQNYQCNPELQDYQYIYHSLEIIPDVGIVIIYEQFVDIKTQEEYYCLSNLIYELLSFIDLIIKLKIFSPQLLEKSYLYQDIKQNSFLSLPSDEETNDIEDSNNHEEDLSSTPLSSHQEKSYITISLIESKLKSIIKRFLHFQTLNKKEDQFIIDLPKDIGLDFQDQQILSSTQDYKRVFQFIIYKIINKNNKEYLISTSKCLQQLISSNLSTQYSDNKEEQGLNEITLLYCRLLNQIEEKSEIKRTSVPKYLNQLAQNFFVLEDNENAIICLEYAQKILSSQVITFESEVLLSDTAYLIAKYHYQIGNYTLLKKYSQESFDIRARLFEKYHPYIALSYLQLSSYYSLEGNYELALKFAEYTLDINLRLYQKSNPMIAASLNNYGVCLENLGEYQNSLNYYKQAQAIYEELFQGINHLDFAIQLSCMGSCYRRMGEYQLALEHEQRSLCMKRSCYKNVNSSIAASLNNIALCYQNLDQPYQSLIFNLSSIDIKKQIHGSCHVDIAISLNNISANYTTLEKYGTALEYLLESLSIIKQLYDENHIQLASTFNNLSQCYRNLKDFQKSLEYAIQSLKIAKNHLPKNHPELIIYLYNTGLCYLDEKQIKLALINFEEALHISESSQNQLYLFRCPYYINVCYFKLKEYQRAQEYAEQSLKLELISQNSSEVLKFRKILDLCQKKLSTQSQRCYQIINKNPISENNNQKRQIIINGGYESMINLKGYYDTRDLFREDTIEYSLNYVDNASYYLGKNYCKYPKRKHIMWTYQNDYSQSLIKMNNIKVARSRCSEDNKFDYLQSIDCHESLIRSETKYFQDYLYLITPLEANISRLYTHLKEFQNAKKYEEKAIVQFFYLIFQVFIYKELQDLQENEVNQTKTTISIQAS